MWTFALVADILFALAATALMIPIPFPTRAEKRTAITAALFERFFHGFYIGPVTSSLDANSLLTGALLGLGLSVGTALITKSYAPVLILGLLGGVAVGIAYEIVL